MNPIIVKTANMERLSAMLDAGQRGATARTLDVYAVLAFSARLDADAPLPLSIMPKGDWKGASIIWRPKHSLPNSYKWRADATCIRLECRASGWALSEVWRETANESESRRIGVIIPAETASIARERFESLFTVGLE